MAYSQNFPAQRPSFMFDASNSGRIPPNMTYTRASTANVFDGSKHESSQNLVVQSQDLDTSPWTVFPGTPAVTGGQSAPDGTTTAWVVTAQTASSAISQAQQSVSVGATKTYTLSAYLKAGTASHTYMTLRGSGSTYGFVEIDWSDPLNPRVTTRTFTSASATVTAVGSGGWYRVALTTTTDAGTTSGTVYIGPSDGTTQNANGYPVWNSSGETALAWGVQLEERGSATVYNPTTTQIHREYASSLVSKANNIGRFEVGTDGQSMGLLVEGSSTQLLTYASDFGGSWQIINSTKEIAAVGPDGTLSAIAFREGTNSDQKRLLKYFGNVGPSVTISIYAKLLGNTRRLVIREANATAQTAWFDLVSGTSGNGTIEAVGNGWFRCSLSFTSSSTPMSAGFYIVPADGTSYTDSQFAGDGYSGLLLAHPQAENQLWASSWISSTTATVTRAADSLSIPIADTGYTGGPVSVVAEFDVDAAAPVGSGVVRRFAMAQLGGTEFGLYQATYGGAALLGVAGGSALTGSSLTAGANKAAMSYDTNDVAICANGGSVTTDTSQELVDASGLNFYVGGETGGASALNGHVKRVALYSEALTDTNLQALTS